MPCSIGVPYLAVRCTLDATRIEYTAANNTRLFALANITAVKPLAASHWTCHHILCCSIGGNADVGFGADKVM